MPSLFVVVTGLPKGARVEKQTMLHTGRQPINSEDDDMEAALVRSNTDGMKSIRTAPPEYYLRSSQSYMGQEVPWSISNSGFLENMSYL